jgi:hypothetical protein
MKIRLIVPTEQIMAFLTASRAKERGERRLRLPGAGQK